jgi:hypothetical protein
MMAVSANAGTSNTDYVNMRSLAELVELQRTLNSLTLILGWIRLQESIQLIPKVGPIVSATILTLGSMATFSFLAYFLFFTFSFSVGLRVAFGTHISDFTSGLDSFLAVLRAFFGEASGFTSMRESNYYLGTVLYFAMAIVGSLTLMNIFIAIVSEEYVRLAKQAEEAWEDDVTDKMADARWGKFSLDDSKSGSMVGPLLIRDLNIGPAELSEHGAFSKEHVNNSTQVSVSQNDGSRVVWYDQVMYKVHWRGEPCPVSDGLVVRQVDQHIRGLVTISGLETGHMYSFDNPNQSPLSQVHSRRVAEAFTFNENTDYHPRTA